MFHQASRIHDLLLHMDVKHARKHASTHTHKIYRFLFVLIFLGLLNLGVCVCVCVFPPTRVAI